MYTRPSTLIISSIIALCSITGIAQARSDSTVKDPVLDRPLTPISGSTALGGYAELNSHYRSDHGVIEGFTFEFRRFNIFLYSAISKHVRFFSELEFEHGTEEIALETAQLDIEVTPAAILRGGIILVPLGRFNQNHDSPKWDFIERPLVSTEIIPSTFSEVGAGIHGQFEFGSNFLNYEVYAVNGLQEQLLIGPEGRTHLASGKSEEFFAEDNNGSPAITGKLTSYIGESIELGVSGYVGAYNSYLLEGEEVQPRRDLVIAAIDGEFHISDLTVQAEAAIATIDVPPSLTDVASRRQQGAFVELTHPITTFALPLERTIALTGGLRADYIDLNAGRFSTSGDVIYDDRLSLTVSLAGRTSASTVVKLNYSHDWVRDILGNPSQASAIRAGVASYF